MKSNLPLITREKMTAKREIKVLARLAGRYVNNFE